MGVSPPSPPNPALIVPINMISTHTSYYPWIIPHLDKMDSYGTVMPLSPIKKYYMETLLVGSPAETDPNQPLDLELDQFSLPYWAKDSPLSHDFLENVLPLE